MKIIEGMEPVNPIHKAILIIRKQREELEELEKEFLAMLPQRKERPATRRILNPLTGEVEIYEKRKKKMRAQRR